MVKVSLMVMVPLMTGGLAPQPLFMNSMMAAELFGSGGEEKAAFWLVTGTSKETSEQLDLGYLAEAPARPKPRSASPERMMLA
jgi:hypothetical protein